MTKGSVLSFPTLNVAGSSVDLLIDGGMAVDAAYEGSAALRDDDSARSPEYAGGASLLENFIAPDHGERAVVLQGAWMYISLRRRLVETAVGSAALDNNRTVQLGDRYSDHGTAGSGRCLGYARADPGKTNMSHETTFRGCFRLSAA